MSYTKNNLRALDLSRNRSQLGSSYSSIWDMIVQFDLEHNVWSMPSKDKEISSFFTKRNWHYFQILANFLLVTIKMLIKLGHRCVNIVNVADYNSLKWKIREVRDLNINLFRIGQINIKKMTLLASCNHSKQLRWKKTGKVVWLRSSN